jgi:hypothetical protein
MNKVIQVGRTSVRIGDYPCRSKDWSDDEIGIVGKFIFTLIDLTLIIFPFVGNNPHNRLLLAKD